MTASDMGKKRQAMLSERQRKALGKKGASVRWEGHIAKRPASSRKPKLKIIK